MKPALLIVLLILLSACATAPAQPSYADEDMDGKELFLSLLLPMSHSGGGAFCHSFYFMPAKTVKDKYALILSAGHCVTRNDTAAIVVHGGHDSQTAKMLLIMNNEALMGRFTYDFYIGNITERRPVPTFFTTDEAHLTLRPQDAVITVASPAAIGQTPELQRLRFQKLDTDGELIFEAEKDMDFGFSGAPVTTSKGKLLGVLLGWIDPNRRLYRVMPINRIVNVMRQWDKR